MVVGCSYMMISQPDGQCPFTAWHHQVHGVHDPIVDSAVVWLGGRRSTTVSLGAIGWGSTNEKSCATGRVFEGFSARPRQAEGAAQREMKCMNWDVRVSGCAGETTFGRRM